MARAASSETKPGLKEHRQYPRYPLHGQVGISWQDLNGHFRNQQVKGVDICVSGIQVEAREAIEPRSNVTIRTERFNLSASTSVRYCRRQGPRFRIGLEFTGGLHWRPPQADSDVQPT